MKRFMLAFATLVLLTALCVPAAAEPNTELGLAVKVTVFAGFQSGEEPTGAGRLLVPGIVIVPGMAPEENQTAKSLAERLRTGFGLAKVEASPTANLFLQPGAEETVNTSAGKIDVRIKLIQYTIPAAAFEVAIVNGKENLGEAKLIVERGKQGIMGGRDGAEAPYFFVVLEPRVALPPPAPGIHKVDEPGIKSPKLIKKIAPVYPEEARKAGVTGDVIVSALIGEDGAVQHVEVLRPLEKGCTEAAVEAVKQWLYEPARSAETGKPVRVYFTVTVAFRLN